MFCALGTSASAASFTINVTNAETNANLGYVSNIFNAYGEYTLGNQSSALSVTPFGSSLFVLNPTYFLFGAISGFANTSDDLGAGSYNYAYLGGIGATNSFSDYTNISRSSQSSIWSVNGNQLSASWTNSNNTVVSPTIMLIQGFFALTGDAAAFTDRFGTATAVKFTLQEIKSQSVQPTAEAVPEPSTVFSAAAALVSLVILRRNRR